MAYDDPVFLVTREAPWPHSRVYRERDELLAFVRKLTVPGAASYGAGYDDGGLLVEEAAALLKRIEGGA